MRLKRFPLLCPCELRGAFRYRDLFQLLPAGPNDPSPPSLIASWGLTLELQLEERASPERETDIWAHDIRERKRYNKLQSTSKSPDSGRLQTVRVIMEQVRPRAIVRELTNLLSVITRHSFRSPDTGHAWVRDAEMDPPRARYMQLLYPTFGHGPNTFSTDKNRRRFASRLYDLRSAIAHRGEPLREDEFDSGFTTGGRDSQWEYRDVGFTLTQEILRGWLHSNFVRSPQNTI